jgi:hypothetical protein
MTDWFSRLLRRPNTEQSPSRDEQALPEPPREMSASLFADKQLPRDQPRIDATGVPRHMDGGLFRNRNTAHQFTVEVRGSYESPSSTHCDDDADPVTKAQRLVERDINELLATVRVFLADGVISDGEIESLSKWSDAHPAARVLWPLSIIFTRLQRMFADGIVDDLEREDLARLFCDIEAGVVSRGSAEAVAALPIDAAQGPIEFTGQTFVLTGRFAYGPRRVCEKAIRDRGGAVGAEFSNRTTFVVVGTFASTFRSSGTDANNVDRARWARSYGHNIRIVSEDHWAKALMVGE